MNIYYCKLTLHDNIFFATREMGILYETEKYLHNWALSYAFFKGVYIPHPYRLQGKKAQKPDYLEADSEQNLLHLNQAKIYVFPAKPLRWSYQINTFKAAQTNYYGKADRFGEGEAKKNYPANFGRAKELAVGSEYCTYIFSANSIDIPLWIRVGKWLAKVHVQTELIPSSAVKLLSGEYICDHPLNPIDLAPETEINLYNRIVMPPVSLISQAQLQGEYWQLSGDAWKALKQKFPELPNQVNLPQGVMYGARQLIY